MLAERETATFRNLRCKRCGKLLARVSMSALHERTPKDVHVEIVCSDNRCRAYNTFDLQMVYNTLNAG